MNELALFAGAGGGILGGHLLGWRTVCAVEWEPYPASALLARQNDGMLTPFPVWDDIDQGRTLNRLPARDENDEKHMCPLQLDVIERCIHLWTNKDDLVFSPFTGIGSEGYCAVRMGRRFVGSELKPQYWELACQNIRDAATEQRDLFAQ